MSTKTEILEFSSIPALKAAANSADNKFFTPGAMRWFNSKTHGGMIGRRFFITSERMEITPEYPPKFTIRYAIRLENGMLSVETLGEFQQYATLKDAQQTARAAIGTELEA